MIMKDEDPSIEEIIKTINNKQVDHEFFYKVCVILVNSDLKSNEEEDDLKNTINEIVISSFKPVSFVIISVVNEIFDAKHVNLELISKKI